jgi:hypothetical protein
MSATPVAPDAFNREIAPFGRQGCNAWIVLAELKDELGVLPNRTATATAASIFAARIGGWGAGKELRWELRPNV